jgi:hypothetical protein
MEIYYLQDSTDQETHDTVCCCGMPSELPHKAIGASLYKLDVLGLQALYALLVGQDDVSFGDWLNDQESQGTFYGCSEDAAIAETIYQAGKDGMPIINYAAKERLMILNRVQELRRQVVRKWEDAPSMSAIRSAWYAVVRELNNMDEMNVKDKQAILEHWLQKEYDTLRKTVLRETLKLFEKLEV